MKQLLFDDKSSIEITDNCLESVVANEIKNRQSKDNHNAFIVGDLGNIIEKHEIWRSTFPRVEPFYAVKCNDDPVVLSLLASLGMGFTCTNKNEIEKVIKLGVPASRIMCSSPCKLSSHIHFAAKNHVDLMTFDTEAELQKIKAKYPSARLLVSIDASGESEMLAGGFKIGCRPKRVLPLLCAAQQMDMKVVGVSLNIDASQMTAEDYLLAVATARTIFDSASATGLRLNILNIGVGLRGHRLGSEQWLEQVSPALRPALDWYFPEGDDGVRIMVEASQYFVASAFTLAVNVIACHLACCVDDVNSGNEEFKMAMNEIYISDGVYGSFGFRLLDQPASTPLLAQPEKYLNEPLFVSNVFGPTGDDMDFIIGNCLLPCLAAGDWLLFRDMGAYAVSENGGEFNDTDYVERRYLMPPLGWQQFVDMTAIDVSLCTATADVN